MIAPSAPVLLDARTERELGERVGSTEAGKQRATAEVARARPTLDKSSADLDRAIKSAERLGVGKRALSSSHISG